ncbi:MAG TPA: 6-phospho-beta-glucosidase, partial [Bacillota bacterium]|nr:6-phospho-beta-glucosidase [Bacillota bacterium]
TQVMEVEKELFRVYNNIQLDKKPEQLEKRGGAFYSDAAVSLISSIYNNSKDIHTVNVRNNGTISSLPDDVVIEANSVVGSSGARPLAIGRLDDSINGLVQTVKSYELLTV